VTVPIESLEALVRGLVHPLLTPSHALALVGLGLLIGQQAADRRSLPLILFAFALAGGLAALTLALDETPAGNILLAGVALCGTLAAIAAPLSIWFSGPLAVLTGATLGLDSPPEVISLTDAYLMLIGTWLGASIALAIVRACAARAARHWQQIGVRVLGSWTAASAMLALAIRLTR
jgi:hydrogenase/urease accessory protein HupE